MTERRHATEHTPVGNRMINSADEYMKHALSADIQSPYLLQIRVKRNPNLEAMHFYLHKPP